jgi:ribosome-associated heat shock protein Hsp15
LFIRVDLKQKCASLFPMPENPPSSVRLDKWLWAVRVFKTRTLAADACRHGRVTIDGQPVKPSREVKVNDIIVVLKDEVSQRFKVLQPLKARVGAQKVREFAENQTPPSALQKPRHSDPGPPAVRPRGSGRPTKKERRQIERLLP